MVHFFSYYKKLLGQAAKWLLLTSVVGFLSGSASALFLTSLDWVGNFRDNHIYIVFVLPVAGIAIYYLYHWLSKESEGGNNLIIDTINQQRKAVLPILMAPLVLVSTLITHLFGGSAGREGTAVQMAGTIADQFSVPFKLSVAHRQILLKSGVAAGFASVFGTPLAGMVFALEFNKIGKIDYKSILPVLFAAVIADYTTTIFWGVGHTHYQITQIPEIGIKNLFLSIIAGIAFGLAARLFSVLTFSISSLSNKLIRLKVYRLVLGGALLVTIFFVQYLLGNQRYIGLGVPYIVESFSVQSKYYDFLFKLILTALTVGVGYKGGEVTPLFYIGATLGSFLSVYMALPTSLLAGMGFVAVFAGAANTPLACIFMGIELFGSEGAIYLAIAVIVAYLFSGHTGIYRRQIIGSGKSDDAFNNKHLSDI